MGSFALLTSKPFSLFVYTFFHTCAHIFFFYPRTNQIIGVVANEKAGPAVCVSFIIAAIVAGLAAMSYAEMACLVPIAGSAYTYTYATCGELMAWIIGWDL